MGFSALAIDLDLFAFFIYSFAFRDKSISQRILFVSQKLERMCFWGILALSDNENDLKMSPSNKRAARVLRHDEYNIFDVPKKSFKDFKNTFLRYSKLAILKVATPQKFFVSSFELFRLSK